MSNVKGKSRTIDSFVKPVLGVTEEHTKRKVDVMNRAAIQRCEDDALLEAGAKRARVEEIEQRQLEKKNERRRFVYAIRQADAEAKQDELGEIVDGHDEVEINDGELEIEDIEDVDPDREKPKAWKIRPKYWETIAREYLDANKNVLVTCICIEDIFISPI